MELLFVCRRRPSLDTPASTRPVISRAKRSSRIKFPTSPSQTPFTEPIQLGAASRFFSRYLSNFGTTKCLSAPILSTAPTPIPLPYLPTGTAACSTLPELQYKHPTVLPTRFDPCGPTQSPSPAKLPPPTLLITATLIKDATGSV